MPSHLTFLEWYIGEGNGTPLQYSCLENPMDGGAWRAAVHGVAKSRTRLSDFPFTFHFHALEKEMATHSSVLAWRIPGTGEPGGLPSLGSHRVGHDWSDLAAAAAAAVVESKEVKIQGEKTRESRLKTNKDKTWALGEKNNATGSLKNNRKSKIWNEKLKVSDKATKSERNELLPLLHPSKITGCCCYCC